jgi:hypothetical protein
MAKYLYLASYTTEGLKGLLKDGGSKRKEDLGTAVKALNGRLETSILPLEKMMSIALSMCPTM